MGGMMDQGMMGGNPQQMAMMGGPQGGMMDQAFG